MFLKNKNIIFKIRRSKVTDYAALISKTDFTVIKYSGQGSFKVKKGTIDKLLLSPAFSKKSGGT